MKKFFFESTVKKNIVANFGGSITQALLGVVFVPLYIKFIGIEAWGLIGVFTTLQAVLGLMDVGLSGSLTRETARLSVLPGKGQEMRNLVRTLETIYWVLAIFVGIMVVLLSSSIAHYWVKAEQLSTQTIEQSILIMGFIMASQMPIGFYSGGLIGLQKQVVLNSVNICIAVLRGAGVLLILWLVSPTIQAYLLWQAGISVVHVFFIAFFLWRNLPIVENKTVFQKRIFKDIWKFTAGMSGISILAVILTQLDKVILSKLLSLEAFGYYMLASTVAMSLGRLFTPVFFSIYPKFTQLVASDNQYELVKLYHKSCQLMSVLILPVALVIAFFSYEVIFLWTQDLITAEKTHYLVSIMIVGTALNGIMNPPYALQLAFGWTKLSVLKNIIAVVLLAPLISYSAIRYGAIGAASMWVLLNISYVLFEIPIMHRRLLRNEKWHWYWQDVFVPLMVTFCCVGAGRLLFTHSVSNFAIASKLIIVSILTFAITLISVPEIKAILYSQIRKLNMDK